MLVKTRFFGDADIEDSKVITLVNGLLGFEDQKRYVLLYDSEKHQDHGDTISWLQSVDDQYLALPVVNPLYVKHDYNPEIDTELLEPLGDPGEDGYFVLVPMRIPGDPTQITCNLKAPIIINTKTMMGSQIIAENDDYPIRYNIYDLVSSMKDEKEGE